MKKSTTNLILAYVNMVLAVGLAIIFPSLEWWMIPNLYLAAYYVVMGIIYQILEF